MVGKYLIIVPIITGMYNKLQTKYNGIVFLMYSFHVQGSKLLPEGCGFPAHVSGSLTQLFRC